MNVARLVPYPAMVEPFRRDRQKFVPDRAGCYVLATATGHILYAGLTTNLRLRMGQHLDTPEKVAPTREGCALCFHWLTATELEPIERGWLNAHRLVEGRPPILNKLDSPVAS